VTGGENTPNLVQLPDRRRFDLASTESLRSESNCAVIALKDGGFPIENLLARDAVRCPGNRLEAFLIYRFFTA
jgi:hypothetical protein